MSLQQLQTESQLQEAHEKCSHLQIQLDSIKRERQVSLVERDGIIDKMRVEVNQLEQQLIQAKLDCATVKTQLQEEKNRAIILKKQIKDQEKASMVMAVSKSGPMV